MQLAFRGEHRIAAPRELVWHLLHDPETLRRCSSGVEAIEVVDPGNWNVRVAVGIGPSSAMLLKASAPRQREVSAPVATPPRLSCAITAVLRQASRRLGEAGSERAAWGS